MLAATRCNAFSFCCNLRRAKAVRCVGTLCVAEYSAAFGAVTGAVTAYTADVRSCCPDCYEGTLSETTLLVCDRCRPYKAAAQVVEAIKLLATRGPRGRISDAQQAARHLLSRAGYDAVEEVEEAEASLPPGFAPAAEDPEPEEPMAFLTPSAVIRAAATKGELLTYEEEFALARNELYAALQAVKDAGAPPTASLSTLFGDHIRIQIDFDTGLSIAVPAHTSELVTAAVQTLFAVGEDQVASDITAAFDMLLQPEVQEKVLLSAAAIEAKAAKLEEQLDETKQLAKRLRLSVSPAPRFTAGGTQLM